MLQVKLLCQNSRTNNVRLLSEVETLKNLMKNILITSVGRRVELVQAFKKEINQLLPSSLLHAIDLKPELSAACQVADFKNVCPPATNLAYIDFLLDYCTRNHIGLVIPTIDTELDILARHKNIFIDHGITLCISDTELVRSCRDKRNTGLIFQKYDISYPEIYSRESLKFPCFAKPYNGSCSIGTKVIKTQGALDHETLSNPQMIFMELIGSEYSEYTIDAYYDKDSYLKCLVPRKRLEVRAGEVSKGITRKNFIYENLKKKIQYIEGARGCLTIQFFVNEEVEHYIGLEINPRFGGGFPLSYAAGANYPAWLIKEYLLNETIDYYEQWEDNLIMLRYDAKVLVPNAKL